MNPIDKAVHAARFASDKKGEEITVLDLQGVCTFTDAFVVVTGTTSVQLRAMAESIKLGIADMEKGERPIIEGDQHASWIVMDYGDIFVHLMDPEAREFYDLESLWGDGKTVEWETAEVGEH